MGPVIGGSPEKPFFAHGGINAGFENSLVAYERTGDGAVVMTNAQGGQLLADAVIRSIASVYGWPNFHPIVRASIAVDPAVLATYVGVYELTPTLSIAVTLENGQLMEQASNERKFPIFPESPSKFFLKVVDAQLEFITEPNGQVSQLVWHQHGQDTRLERKKIGARHTKRCLLWGILRPTVDARDNVGFERREQTPLPFRSTWNEQIFLDIDSYHRAAHGGAASALLRLARTLV